MKTTRLRPIWDITSPTIQFINGGDFEMNSLLERLGLGESRLTQSLGCADRDEILSRQELVRLLWDDPRLLDWCLYGKKIPVALVLYDPDDFLNNFNPKRSCTPYLGSVSRTKDTLKRAIMRSKVVVRGKLKTFLDHLDRTIDSAKKLERAYADAIYPELEQQARYHGMVRIRFEWGRNPKISNMSSEAVGWRQYSYQLSSKYRIFRYPKNKFWGGLTRVLSWIAFPIPIAAYIWNYQMEKRKFAPLLQRNFPSEMLGDVCNYAQALASSMTQQYYARDMQMNQETSELQGKAVDLTLAVNYGEDGLRIQLLNHVVESRADFPKYLSNKLEEFFDQYGSTGQYTGKFRRIVQKLDRQMANKWNGRLFEYNLQKLLKTLIHEQQPSLWGPKGVTIDHRGSKKMLGREVLQVILSVRPDIKLMHEEIEAYRSEIQTVLGNLHEVAGLVWSMKKKVKTIDKPLCFPKIFEDEEHLVEFKNLYPIHLIGRTNNIGRTVTGKQLVAINELIPINGQMVALTGQNAGGKTATEVELINAIFLAQSGLPVFAESFGLNPKRVVGMVFVERGEGSLLQLLLQKTKNILEAVEGKDKNHVFIVIDELLTGTQEASGFEIGKKVLSKLAQSGASVVFSTQITGLAEYAVNHLDAKAFAFDIHHQVTPGIASGDPDLLIRELGMKELLNTN